MGIFKRSAVKFSYRQKHFSLRFSRSARRSSQSSIGYVYLQELCTRLVAIIWRVKFVRTWREN